VSGPVPWVCLKTGLGVWRGANTHTRSQSCAAKQHRAPCCAERAPSAYPRAGLRLAVGSLILAHFTFVKLALGEDIGHRPLLLGRFLSRYRWIADGDRQCPHSLGNWVTKNGRARVWQCEKVASALRGWQRSQEIAAGPRTSLRLRLGADPRRVLNKIG
jgi:hypothetical protein